MLSIGDSICAAPLTRGRRKGKPATGTHAGYERHRRIGEKPCEACHAAHNAWKRSVYATNAAYRERQRQWSKKRRFRSYGLTEGKYLRLLADQKNRCAICRTDEPGGSGTWSIDHDHACCAKPLTSCGRCVRGLLCDRCNRALGIFGDDPALLRAAISYLEDAGAS